MERSEERRRARKVALGLCKKRLGRNKIEVVWRNIENLINLSKRLGKRRSLI